MSVDNYVFVERRKMPSPEAWADAVKAHGFAMEMDTDFDAEEFEGFLPCIYKGEAAGFEYFFDEVDPEWLAEWLSQDEIEQIGERDVMVTLVTHSDCREALTSVIAAGVLCTMADGVLAENGEPPLIPAGEAIGWARAGEAELASMIEDG